ncbi:MAG: hypothetical protein ACR2QQ_01250 [Gammaproteobacteria bacterium]
MRTYKAAISLLLFPAISFSQASISNCSDDSSIVSAEPLIIDPNVVDHLRDARQCLERLDTDCARAAVEIIDSDGLESDTFGAYSLLVGDIASLDGDFDAAESSYSEASGLPAAHLEIRRGAMTRLAILFLRRGEFQRILANIDSAQCDELTPELGFIEASAHFDLEDYENALTSIETAISAQSDSDMTVPEAWYDVRDAARQGLAGENLFCSEEVPLGSHIPVEQCYTREELRQIAFCERSARARRAVNPTFDCTIR